MLFAITPPLNQVSVSGLNVSVNCASFANTIRTIYWNGANGLITFNDSPTDVTTFSDPSPYQNTINSWLNNAANVTLGQAINVKSDYLLAIYNVKRQANLSFNVTAGNFLWNVADYEVAKMGFTLAGYVSNAFANTLTNLQTIFTTLVANINVLIDSYNANVQGVPDLTAITISNTLNVNITWVPLGQNTTVQLLGPEFVGLVSSVKTRAANVYASYLTIAANLNLQSSLANVIAFDVTAGWPF